MDGRHGVFYAWLCHEWLLSSLRPFTSWRCTVSPLFAMKKMFCMHELPTGLFLSPPPPMIEGLRVEYRNYYKLTASVLRPEDPLTVFPLRRLALPQYGKNQPNLGIFRWQQEDANGQQHQNRQRQTNSMYACQHNLEKLRISLHSHTSDTTFTYQLL